MGRTPRTRAPPAFLQATPLLPSRGSLSLSPPQRRLPPALSTEHRALTTPACLPCQQFRHLPSSPHLFPTVSPRGRGLAVLPQMGLGPTLYSACIIPSWLSSIGCSVTSDTLPAGVLWHHLLPGHPGGGTTSRQPRGPNPASPPPALPCLTPWQRSLSQTPGHRHDFCTTEMSSSQGAHSE